MAGPRKFFEEQSDQSEIKARIVQKYFDVWSKIIAPSAQQFGSNRIAYIDLYAGPGRYKDGSASTPLLILEKAIADPKISQMLVALFNDGSTDFSNTLREEIAQLKGIEKLKHKPQVLNSSVGKDFEDMFQKSRLIPTFSFIDPFGYKGLSLKIVNAVIKDWGCDCIFFFNYGRINAGLSNEKVDEHMDALFGAERAERMRKELEGMNPAQREAFILEELAQAIKELGGKFVLPFRFRREDGKRTSHCLIFVSKHVKGYNVMKQIMAAESSIKDQGVPSFTYSPAEERFPLLFSLARPLDALEDELPKKFAGQSLPMLEIFNRHHIDTPYIEKNYKEALRKLEEKGKINCDPPSHKRPKRHGEVTFGDKVMVKFQ